MKKLDKYTELRQKLDFAKYKYHFDISSISLIEKLLNDVNKLSKENSSTKNENTRIISENENFQININALKAENSRLVKENNDLHREILELKKKNYSSTTAKEIGIMKLEEEKNSFKFLYLNAREKCDKIKIENDSLKTRLSGIVIKLYEGNMNEGNLRKMYENELNAEENFKLGDELQGTNSGSGFKTNSINNDESRIHLGVFVKPRGITQNSNLNMDMTALTNNNQNNENFVKEIIKETFGKSQVHEGDVNNVNNIKSINTLSSSKGGMNISPNANTNNKINSIPSSTTNEKIKILEKEIEDKNSEISRLNYYMRSENNFNNGNRDLQLMVNYLKQEKQTIIEKYEKRIEFLLNTNSGSVNIYTDNKNDKNNKNTCIKKNNKKEEINITNNSNTNTNNPTYYAKLTRLEEENLKLKAENEILKIEINNCKQNYLEKSVINLYIEKEKQLNHDLAHNHELIKQLDTRVKEGISNLNTAKSVYSIELLELNNKMKKLTNQIDSLNSENAMKIKEIEELKEKINFLNLNILQKENFVNSLNEKFEKTSENFCHTEMDKKELNAKIIYLKEKNSNLIKENILNMNEIERLKNFNFVLEKQNEMLEIKIKTITNSF
jgi:hypothetical protein